MTMIVNQALCNGCGVCEGACPVDAIHLHNDKAYIDQSLCTCCQICVELCPTGALQLIKSEAPIVIKQPEIIERTPSRNVGEFEPEKTSLGAMMLMLFGQHMLPRLTDTLATFLERLLENPLQEHPSVTAQVSRNQPFRRHRKQRRRMLKNYSVRRW